MFLVLSGSVVKVMSKRVEQNNKTTKRESEKKQNLSLSLFSLCFSLFSLPQSFPHKNKHFLLSVALVVFILSARTSFFSLFCLRRKAHASSRAAETSSLLFSVPSTLRSVLREKREREREEERERVLLLRSSVIGKKSTGD